VLTLGEFKKYLTESMNLKELRLLQNIVMEKIQNDETLSKEESDQLFVIYLKILYD
jgi:hypothetical protein